MKHVTDEVRKSDLRELPLVRLSAHDGNTLALDGITDLVTPVAEAELREVAALGMRRHHSQLTMGAVGCYLSHMDAWAHVADLASPDPVLILEDDVKIPRRSLLKMSTAWEHAVAKQAAGGEDHLPLVLLYESMCMLDCRADTAGLSQDGYFWGARAYAVTPSGAALLRALPFLPMDIQVDHQLIAFRDAGLLTLYVYRHVGVRRDSVGATNIQVTIMKNAPRSRAGPSYSAPYL